MPYKATRLRTRGDYDVRAVSIFLILIPPSEIENGHPTRPYEPALNARSCRNLVQCPWVLLFVCQENRPGVTLHKR